MDQVTGHLSAIAGFLASGYLDRALECLVLKPSFMSKKTKIGLD